MHYLVANCNSDQLWCNGCTYKVHLGTLEAMQFVQWGCLIVRLTVTPDITGLPHEVQQVHWGHLDKIIHDIMQ